MLRNKKNREGVIIIGASGMLGADLVSLFTQNSQLKTTPIGREDLDIRERSSVFSAVSSLRPRAVVLSAAYTKVDDCETNRQMAFDINGEGARNVAAACAEYGAHLLFVSTDYVFNGEKDGKYTEEEKTSPVNVYGESKLQGEEGIREVLERHSIIRTSWLFGAGGPNFIKSIVRAAEKTGELKVVDDQRGSPTYTRDLSQAIYHLIEKEVTGVVNITNSGACSWFEFAKSIVDTFGIPGVNITPVKTGDSGRAARRPACSVLDCSRYEALTGERMRPWQEALAAYAAEVRGAAVPGDF